MKYWGPGQVGGEISLVTVPDTLPWQHSYLTAWTLLFDLGVRWSCEHCLASGFEGAQGRILGSLENLR